MRRSVRVSRMVIPGILLFSEGMGGTRRWNNG